MAAWGLYAATTITLLFVFECYSAHVIDPSSTLDCHRRVYSYKVSKTDSQGRQCWDTINVMSCWGRCDSNEVINCCLVISSFFIQQQQSSSSQIRSTCFVYTHKRWRMCALQQLTTFVVFLVVWR